MVFLNCFNPTVMRVIYYLLFFLFVLSSCGQYKRYTYLQTKYPEKDTIYAKKLTPYLLQPSDILHVKISSVLDKVSQELFSSDMANTTSGMASGAGALYLMGNTIDSEGFISLPVIGKVMVGGMTLEEAREKIYQTAITYSSDARVDVKLLSFRITIVGEVKAPGYYTIYSDKATLLEGLSMAGDLTYNGKRKNILILRSFKDGTKTIKVDLTSRDLLSSEKYFLQPNDIIYVAPFKTAAFRAKIADYSVFLTLITSTITAVLLINNAFK